MRTLNRIGFWGWLILITIANVLHVKSCDMNWRDNYAANLEFWLLFIIVIPVFVYMWFRDWSKPKMFDLRKF